MTEHDEIIPDYKLDKELLVNLDEMENYKIYTGFGGQKLKVDESGRSDQWFESINPDYKDYLFKFPYGKRHDSFFGPSDPRWYIIIKKKKFVNLPNVWRMFEDEVDIFLKQYQLMPGSERGRSAIKTFYSEHPELSKYNFKISKEKDEHDNTITQFIIIDKREEDMKKLFDSQIRGNIGRPLTFYYREVSLLNIWTGVFGSYFGTTNQFNLKSTYPSLQGYSFSFPFGLPVEPYSDKTSCTLIITAPIPPPQPLHRVQKDIKVFPFFAGVNRGGSRKHKNSNFRKSRKYYS